jgi:hypothetical protein
VKKTEEQETREREKERRRERAAANGRDGGSRAKEPRFLQAAEGD